MLGWTRLLPESDPTTLVALSLAGIIGYLLLNNLAGSRRSHRWYYGFKACCWAFALGCMIATVVALFAHVPAFVAWLAWVVVGIVVVAALITAGKRWRREAQRKDASRTNEHTR